jgi:NAD(P)-dependent dehydrogenase (short-subunit alcohol dehydrogenase family)
MPRVKDKVAIVTGGSRGIGRAACILLAKEGAKVAITDVIDSEGRQLEEEIRAFDGVAKPPYHASKGAVRLMSKTDALLYAKDKIRVNSIHPGYIWTPMVENFLKSQGNVEEGRKQIDTLHPLGHIGEADDIAYAILYLASEESKFVTGAELVVDGGYTVR